MSGIWLGSDEKFRYSETVTREHPQLGAIESSSRESAPARFTNFRDTQTNQHAKKASFPKKKWPQSSSYMREQLQIQ